ncbi:hypothetical protein HK096_002678 [Nowakowskiella sp. JEL0078]|nr:hypothetical protein HK096_002678 [Nowakowskiella sp. JEL0078]
MGDVVLVEKGQKFPVDAMLISTSYEDGTCFIETSELDGETNLKRRSAVSMLASRQTVDSINAIIGKIECEAPNENLNTFEGRVTIGNGKSERSTTHALTMNQLLLRGAVLRNTDFAYAAVVYCGSNTKIIKNLKRAAGKQSTLEKKLNTFVLWAFLYNAVLLVSASLLEVYRYLDLRTREITLRRSQPLDYAVEWYLGPQDQSVFSHSLTTVISYFGIFTYVIPISLFVSIEMVRLAQGQFMVWDKQMQAVRQNNDRTMTKVKMRANNTNLNEDLGCVEYIFSDKTGTLTQNLMKLALFFIDGDVLDEMQNPGSLNQYIKVNESSRFTASLFARALALAHGVIPSLDPNTNEMIYESQSPDETALLTSMETNDVKLISRTKNLINIKTRGINESYELLASLEFTSDRKRMSAVVRTPDGQIHLYCKGADNIIFERLSRNPSVNNPNLLESASAALDRFSETGLRTLVIAYRKLTDEEFYQFKTKLDQAEQSLSNREANIDQACEMVERELTILGCTAIEDKLQDEVPETIDYLLKCDIRLWLLTGDKQETAINIGRSSKLISVEMNLMILNGNSDQDTSTQLDNMIAEVERMGVLRRHALVVNGVSLSHIFKTSTSKSETKRWNNAGNPTPDTPLDVKFLHLGTRCHSVICCRVTPLQKALVVKLVRKNLNKVCLSIGDGANDVSMIQEANIGVGIMGREGTQAVRASDYAFQEFKFLRRLISVHGRYSFMRMSLIILYSFYKNLAFITVQWWFGWVSGWSGQIVYEQMFFTGFNVVFTSLPPIILAIFERDVSEDRISIYPELYRESKGGVYWNLKEHFAMLLSSIWHSLALFGCVWFINSEGSLDPEGYSIGYWVQCYLFGTPMLLTVLLKCALMTKHWVWLSWTFLLISFALNIALMFFLEVFNWIEVGTPEITHILPTYYFVCVLVPIVCLLPDFLTIVKQQYFPSDANLIMEESNLLQRSQQQQRRTTPTTSDTYPMVAMGIDEENR